MLTVPVVVLSVLMIGSLVFYFACGIAIRQFFVHRESIAASQDAETLPSQDAGISLLVPVCGLESKAWEHWSSFCSQDYPRYEVLFGVKDPDDPAVPLLEKLLTAFPDRVRLLTGLEPRGINHKDSNLTYLLDIARYEIVVFADSDIQVDANYLRTVAAPLGSEKVGIVTCGYVDREPQSLGAALASLGRCCDFIPSMLIARTLDSGLKFAVGKTIAMRRSVLEGLGGLQLNRVGSDYYLGKMVAGAGYQVKLSPNILEWGAGRASLRQVFLRELRWARTIRFNRGPQYYTMVFCYGFVYCIPLLLISRFAPWSIALSLLILAIRYAQAIFAITSTSSLPLLRWLWALPLRDLMSFLIWAVGTFGRRVYWRGRQLQVEGDGLISQVE